LVALSAEEVEPKTPLASGAPTPGLQGDVV